MNLITAYECETCGFHALEPEPVQLCEARGVPSPSLEVGATGFVLWTEYENQGDFQHTHSRVVRVRITGVRTQGHDLLYQVEVNPETPSAPWQDRVLSEEGDEVGIIPASSVYSTLDEAKLYMVSERSSS